MERPIFNEIFEYPIKEFREHLENPINERIIFSGKYGIGKTQFLENYFKQEANINKYDVYRLFPVNYSVSSNEDIIRYIKYDILIEMLKKKKTLDEFDLRFIDTLPEYVKNNVFKVVAATIAMVPKVGKSISDAFESIDKLKDKFIEFHNKITKTEGDIVVEYLEQLESQEGGLYEDDIVTKIISGAIVKGKPNESILIVDDIDRLDPEHVFRILNVFAAHFDKQKPYEKNKFSFDKVIVVCDFHNIRNLFHHRYGLEVDFIGYIDKFFSSDIYFFDNKNAIINIIGTILNSASFQTRGNEALNVIGQLYFQNGFINNIATLLLERNFISLRSLLRLYGRYIPYHYEEVLIEGDRVRASSLLVIIQLKFIKDFFGDYDTMIKTLVIAAENKYSIDGFEAYFGQLVHLLAYDPQKSSSGKDIDFTFNGCRVLIEPSRGFSIGIVNGANVYEYKESANGSPDRGFRFIPSVEQFWQAMIDSTKKLHRLGYLK